MLHYISMQSELEQLLSKVIQMDERHLASYVIKWRDPQVTIRSLKRPHGALFLQAESNLYDISSTEGHL